MKKSLLIFTVLCLVLGHMNAYAQDQLSYQSCWYSDNGTLKSGAKVVRSSTTYSGNIVIPETTKISNVEVPVVRIDDGAFGQCTGLTSLKIGSNVRTIGGYAFSGCGLTSITIPATVSALESRCFEGANKLQSVTIAANSLLTEIPDHAFTSCKALTSVTVGSGSKITSIGAYAFHFTALKTFNMPSTIEKIDEGAFWELPNYNTSAFPSNLKKIGQNAFGDCTSLTTSVLPASVEVVGESAFEGCSSFGPVFKSSNITIGYKAFANCNFNSLTIPAGTYKIAKYAFNSAKVYKLTVESNYFAKNGYEGHGVGENTLISVFGGSVSELTFKTTEIGEDWAGQNQTLRVLNLEPNTIVGARAFDGCYVLGGAFEGEGMNLGENCFAYTKFTSVKLTKCSLWSDAFRRCYSIKEAELIETSVAGSSFDGCSSLETITLKPTDGTTISRNAFKGCEGVKHVYIYNIKAKDAYKAGAFAGCPGEAYIYSDTQQSYNIKESPIWGAFFTELWFEDNCKVVGTNFIYELPYLTSVMVNSPTTLMLPIESRCPSFKTYYQFTSTKLKNYYSCLYNKDVTELLTAPYALTKIILAATTKFISLAGIKNAIYEGAIIDATKLDKFPTVIGSDLVFSTIIVKAGMKKKFLAAAESNANTKTFLDNATFIELAPEPLADVNCDGSVNATDVVSVYNYIINGLK